MTGPFIKQRMDERTDSGVGGNAYRHFRLLVRRCVVASKAPGYEDRPYTAHTADDEHGDRESVGEGGDRGPTQGATGWTADAVRDLPRAMGTNRSPA
jgi:hypothetical protein